MIKRINWKRSERKYLRDMEKDVGFLPTIAQTTIRKTNDITVESMIITHEEFNSKRYAGKVRLRNVDGDSITPYWIATPVFGHAVRFGGVNHSYFIRPVNAERSVLEATLQRHEDIPDTGFSEDRNANMVVKQIIMEGILAYQKFRKFGYQKDPI